MDFFLVLGLVILIPLAIAAVIGAPPVWIPKRAARLMIRESGLLPTEVGHDLGAGMGRLVAIGAKEFNFMIIGTEYVPVLRWIGKILLAFQRVPTERLRRGNFYTMSLADADVCFCFLMPKTLARLKEKFEKELKPGARVVSYAFPISGWIPEHSVKEDGIGTVYVYRR